MMLAILNCAPPAYTIMPSPALSILKGFLNKKGYKSTIVYWNLLFLDLQKQFIFTSKSLSAHPHALLLFVNYIAIAKNDKTLQVKVKSTLMACSPKHIEDIDYHMQMFKEKVDNIIEKTLLQFNFSQALYFGFTLKFEQWLFAFLLSDILKKKYPHTPIIIGGIANKKAAQSFLVNFPTFDIAVWGEGEYALFNLTKKIQSKEYDFKDIANVVYKEQNEIIISSIKPSYLDLSSDDYVMDYDDYFEQRNNVSSYLFDYALTIEFSRGCHWNKCHFCYLNEGYKYRRKSIDKIKSEIIHNIERYGAMQYSVTDNDLVGSDLCYFNTFLDVLIEIRTKYPYFTITMAEIVTKGLNKKYINKIRQAGIRTLQIGYENPSDKLLKKINKINSFASNILFLKFALENKIAITGLNVIYNLFEETDYDILEATLNLKFLRFYRTYYNVKHNITPLTINSTSRYARNYINPNEWLPINSTGSLMIDYWKDRTSWDILDFSKYGKNDLWLNFEVVDKYYCENKHSYSLKDSHDKIIFTEYRNADLKASHSFLKSSLKYKILLLTNDEIVELKSLISKISLASPAEIKMSIDELYEIGILYHNSDYTEIISIINTDLIRRKN